MLFIHKCVWNVFRESSTLCMANCVDSEHVLHSVSLMYSIYHGKIGSTMYVKNIWSHLMVFLSLVQQYYHLCWLPWETLSYFFATWSYFTKDKSVQDEIWLDSMGCSNGLVEQVGYIFALLNKSANTEYSIDGTHKELYLSL